MNTQNENESVAAAGRTYKKLESLPEDKREMIVDLAARTRQIDLVEILREHGIETSVPTLKRFLRKQRAKEVLEDGEEMRASVEALASRGQSESLRKGTMEALRQKMYDVALTSENPEEAKELYREILREEAELKKLELEQRRTAAVEEGVRLQRLRIEVMAAEKGIGNGHERKHRQERTVVVEAGPEIAGKLPDCGMQIADCGLEEVRNAGQLPGPVEREFRESLTEGHEVNEEVGTEKKLIELWRRMGEVLNRGGRPEEKLLEARDVWEEWSDLLEPMGKDLTGKNGVNCASNLTA